MITFIKFEEIALSFNETTTHNHFEKIAFKVDTKIFATYDAKKSIASLKLPEIEQAAFSAFDSTIIYPVNNNWGKQGWTIFELTKVREDLFTDALTIAYQNVAKRPKK